MRVFRSLSIQRHLNARTMSIANSDVQIDTFFFWIKVRGSSPSPPPPSFFSLAVPIEGGLVTLASPLW